MSFRKRNQVVSRGSPDLVPPKSSPISLAGTSSGPGVRPSPIDGRPITSTGTPSLDNLLAGYGGLVIGNSLLIEENGTTDYAGTLTKYFVAEGVLQGHAVHVLGLPEGWGRELPAVTGSEDVPSQADASREKMKIAWRYQGLGEFGASSSTARRAPAVARELPRDTLSQSPETTVFCHTYDLTKRLVHVDISKISHVPVSPRPDSSPFQALLHHLSRALSTSTSSPIHRLVIPNLLSPAIYPPHASHPSHLLRFVQTLRSLLRQYPSRLVIFITLPLSLHPRSTGLIRMLEHLVDGVFELTPFPHPGSGTLPTSGASTSQEEKPQGLVTIHKLPVFHERGGGGSGPGLRGLSEDMAFTVSRRKFEIRPFSLPPAEGDVEAQAGGENGKQEAKAMDF